MSDTKVYAPWKRAILGTAPYFRVLGKEGAGGPGWRSGQCRACGACRRWSSRRRRPSPPPGTPCRPSSFRQHCAVTVIITTHIETITHHFYSKITARASAPSFSSALRGYGQNYYTRRKRRSSFLLPIRRPRLRQRFIRRNLDFRNLDFHT